MYEEDLRIMEACGEYIEDDGWYEADENAEGYYDEMEREFLGEYGEEEGEELGYALEE